MLLERREDLVAPSIPQSVFVQTLTR